MPRPPRDTAAGRFHVVTHAVREEALFRRDVDRSHFLRELARAGSRTEWRCVAYCLMRTHYHLILDVDDGALPKGMHALNFRYASWFNWTYGCRGHAMASRYWARRIEDEADLLVTYKYVVRNPVKARLCVRPEEWLWSSHAGTVATSPRADFVDPADVLACFDGPLEIREAELQAFVAAP